MRGVVLRLDRKTARVRARISVRYPWAIACGDGGLWVTSNFLGLSRIDPKTNSVVATAPIETHLDQVAVAGGFAWTTDEQRGTLYKVDGSGRIEATYETGDGARQISVAGGRVWVANQDVGTVTGVDVTTGDVKTFRFGHPVQTVAALGDRLLVELNDGLTYEDRIDQLRAAAESTDTAEAPILEEGSDGVRLMTVHKAKGLEFPVVILADLTCRMNRADARKNRSGNWCFARSSTASARARSAPAAK